MHYGSWLLMHNERRNQLLGIVVQHSIAAVYCMLHDPVHIAVAIIRREFALLRKANVSVRVVFYRCYVFLFAGYTTLGSTLVGDTISMRTRSCFRIA